MGRRCDLCILQDALTLFDNHAVWSSAAILNHKFSPKKRKYLTLCTMLSNDPDEIGELTDVALKGLTFGMPLPPFSSPKEDAKWWSEHASLSERKAYLVACYSSLSKTVQKDFIAFALKRKINE
ncbi:hypothetical protein N9N20_08890 [Planktomarina temperata]|nr:hypothetical protein [Planktomarina temperata]